METIMDKNFATASICIFIGYTKHNHFKNAK